MTRTGITLNAATANEASVATFARSGASYVRFIAKGMTPPVFTNLAVALLRCGQSVKPSFQVMVDLPGLRPRMGTDFEEFTVFQGMTALLTDQEAPASTYRSNLVVPTLNLMTHRDRVRQGDRLLANDGATELKVLEALPSGLLVEAVRPEARISPNRSILLPDTDIEYQSLAAADRAVIEAIAASAPLRESLVALSMVESVAPIQQLRDSLPGCVVVAKIETRTGLINRAEIAEAADIVMLARGDLSLTLGLEILPAAVGMVIEECQRRGRDAILATGVMEGVGLQGRPTIPDLTDLWHYRQLGVRNFLISGGQPDQHGRQSLEFLGSALDAFRFATEDLTAESR